MLDCRRSGLPGSFVLITFLCAALGCGVVTTLSQRPVTIATHVPIDNGVIFVCGVAKVTLGGVESHTRDQTLVNP